MFGQSNYYNPISTQTQISIWITNPNRTEIISIRFSLGLSFEPDWVETQTEIQTTELKPDLPTLNYSKIIIIIIIIIHLIIIIFYLHGGYFGNLKIIGDE